jgi:hypothetical protein
VIIQPFLTDRIIYKTINGVETLNGKILRRGSFGLCKDTIIYIIEQTIKASVRSEYKPGLFLLTHSISRKGGNKLWSENNKK